MRWRLLSLSILASVVKGQNGCDDECKLMENMQDHPTVRCGKVISQHPKYGNKCIYLTKTRDKWPVMQNVCQQLSWTNGNNTEIKTGNLVTLNNAVENNATRDYINAMNSAESSTTVYFAYAFIGLRKTCRHCGWHWSDNEPFTYSNWWSTEPNTYYYDCTHIRTTGSYDGQWIDMSCSSTYHSVCMFYKSGLKPQPEEPVIPSKGGCKPGWWAYAGYCYRDFGYDQTGGFNTDGHLSYTAGNNSCVAGTGGQGMPDWPGSRMAILPSMQHNSLLAALMGPGKYHNDIWIGIYNNAYYDYYFSLDNFQKLTYDNWVPGYPNHVQSNINKCVRMKWTSETKFQGDAELGQWINDHCTNVRLPYVCSHEQDIQYSNYEYPSWFSLPNVQCPRGWIPYHTSCYKMYNQPMSFDLANQQCGNDKPSGANYATLITAWDEYEILFMESFLRDDQLPNRSPSDLPDGYWIGVKNEVKRGDKRWSFVDNWPMTYTKWAGSDTLSKPGDCGYMAQTGKWDNTNCDSLKPFVCKAEFYDWMPNYEEIDAKLGPILPCEDGWTLHGHHCVKVFTDTKRWNDAEADCSFHGGHLVSIHSENYNQWVRGLFQNATKNIQVPDWDGFWSGMSWTSAEWKWSDKRTVTYFNWRQGEPNNWEGLTEDCVEIYNDGSWNDDPCDNELPYVCKKVAPTQWCQSATTSGSMKRCGEAGTNEDECMRVFGCCWDPTVEIEGPGNHCFKPSAPINVGMAAGAAVAVTLVVIGIVAGGYFYYTKYGIGAPTDLGGFSNPNA